MTQRPSPTKTLWAISAGAILAALHLTSACRQVDLPIAPQPSIRLAADTATTPLAESLLNAYESRQPEMILILEPGSREAMLAALTSGEIDAVLLLHPLDTQTFFSTPIARELLVIIVHPDLELEGLSRSDVRAIFGGQIVTWEAVGGPELPIRVVTREGGSSTRLTFDDLIMDGQMTTPTARIAIDEQHVLEIVNTTPGSVGYVAHNVLDTHVTPLDFEGHPPTLSAARRHTYALSTTVVLVAAEEPQGSLRAFLEWTLSPQGQRVVRRHMLGLND